MSSEASGLPGFHLVLWFTLFLLSSVTHGSLGCGSTSSVRIVMHFCASSSALASVSFGNNDEAEGQKSRIPKLREASD